MFRLYETLFVWQLKARELFQVLGSKDIEGAKDEEWQAVDCKNVLVHLMLPGTVWSVWEMLFSTALLKICWFSERNEKAPGP